MLISLDPSSAAPVYEQIADGIKQQIFDGALASDSELPPVRVLAESLKVNMHTVRRAYRMLADEGIIVMRLGRRTRVSPPRELSEGAVRLIREGLQKVVRDARLAGVDFQHIRKLMEQQLSEMEATHAHS